MFVPYLGAELKLESKWEFLLDLSPPARPQNRRLVLAAVEELEHSQEPGWVK